MRVPFRRIRLGPQIADVVGAPEFRRDQVIHFVIAVGRGSVHSVFVKHRLCTVAGGRFSAGPPATQTLAHAQRLHRAGRQLCIRHQRSVAGRKDRLRVARTELVRREPQAERRNQDRYSGVSPIQGGDAPPRPILFRPAAASINRTLSCVRARAPGGYVEWSSSCQWARRKLLVR